ncbi:hypothetical protein A3Q56_02278 [Intoshia linei]|uniref:HECT-type E3 ubiquitin transferase n=1 Tax=Intoshia linei TaxID=1819745 RepID=A0A177B6V3_9BILA|nr:hypothetical protein A3Q56_02278 [Intoshia linei]
MTIFNESLHLGETNDGQKTWSTLFLRGDKLDELLIFTFNPSMFPKWSMFFRSNLLENQDSKRSSLDYSKKKRTQSKLEEIKQIKDKIKFKIQHKQKQKVKTETLESLDKFETGEININQEEISELRNKGEKSTILRKSHPKVRNAFSNIKRKSIQVLNNLNEDLKNNAQQLKQAFEVREESIKEEIDFEIKENIESDSTKLILSKNLNDETYQDFEVFADIYESRNIQISENKHKDNENELNACKNVIGDTKIDMYNENVEHLKILDKDEIESDENDEVSSINSNNDNNQNIENSLNASCDNKKKCKYQKRDSYTSIDKSVNENLDNKIHIFENYSNHQSLSHSITEIEIDDNSTIYNSQLNFNKLSNICTKIVKNMEAKITSLTCWDEGICLGYEDGTIELYKSTENKSSLTLYDSKNIYPKSIDCISFSSSLKLFAFVMEDHIYCYPIEFKVNERNEIYPNFIKTLEKCKIKTISKIILNKNGTELIFINKQTKFIICSIELGRKNVLNKIKEISIHNSITNFNILGDIICFSTNENLYFLLNIIDETIRPMFNCKTQSHDNGCREFNLINYHSTLIAVDNYNIFLLSPDNMIILMDQLGMVNKPPVQLAIDDFIENVHILYENVIVVTTLNYIYYGMLNSEWCDFNKILIVKENCSYNIKCNYNNQILYAINNAIMQIGSEYEEIMINNNTNQFISIKESKPTIKIEVEKVTENENETESKIREDLNIKLLKNLRDYKIKSFAIWDDGILTGSDSGILKLFQNGDETLVLLDSVLLSTYRKKAAKTIRHICYSKSRKYFIISSGTYLHIYPLNVQLKSNQNVLFNEEKCANFSLDDESIKTKMKCFDCLRLSTNTKTLCFLSKPNTIVHCSLTNDLKNPINKLSIIVLDYDLLNMKLYRKIACIATLAGSYSLVFLEKNNLKKLLNFKTDTSKIVIPPIGQCSSNFVLLSPDNTINIYDINGKLQYSPIELEETNIKELILLESNLLIVVAASTVLVKSMLKDSDFQKTSLENESECVLAGVSEDVTFMTRDNDIYQLSNVSNKCHDASNLRMRRSLKLSAKSSINKSRLRSVINEDFVTMNCIYQSESLDITAVEIWKVGLCVGFKDGSLKLCSYEFQTNDKIYQCDSRELFNKFERKSSIRKIIYVNRLKLMIIAAKQRLYIWTTVKKYTEKMEKFFVFKDNAYKTNYEYLDFLTLSSQDDSITFLTNRRCITYCKLVKGGDRLIHLVHNIQLKTNVVNMKVNDKFACIATDDGFYSIVSLENATISRLIASKSFKPNSPPIGNYSSNFITLTTESMLVVVDHNGNAVFPPFDVKGSNISDIIVLQKSLMIIVNFNSITVKPLTYETNDSQKVILHGSKNYIVYQDNAFIFTVDRIYRTIGVSLQERTNRLIKLNRLNEAISSLEKSSLYNTLSNDEIIMFKRKIDFEKAINYKINGDYDTSFNYFKLSKEGVIPIMDHFVYLLKNYELCDIEHLIDIQEVKSEAQMLIDFMNNQYKINHKKLCHALSMILNILYDPITLEKMLLSLFKFSNLTKNKRISTSRNRLLNTKSGEFRLYDVSIINKYKEFLNDEVTDIDMYLTLNKRYYALALVKLLQMDNHTAMDTLLHFIELGDVYDLHGILLEKLDTEIFISIFEKFDDYYFFSKYAIKIINYMKMDVMKLLIMQNYSKYVNNVPTSENSTHWDYEGIIQYLTDYPEIQSKFIMFLYDSRKIMFPEIVTKYILLHIEKNEEVSTIRMNLNNLLTKCIFDEELDNYDSEVVMDALEKFDQFFIEKATILAKREQFRKSLDLLLENNFPIDVIELFCKFILYRKKGFPKPILLNLINKYGHYLDFCETVNHVENTCNISDMNHFITSTISLIRAQQTRQKFMNLLVDKNLDLNINFLSQKKKRSFKVNNQRAGHNMTHRSFDSEKWCPPCITDNFPLDSVGDVYTEKFMDLVQQEHDIQFQNGNGERKPCQNFINDLILLRLTATYNLYVKIETDYSKIQQTQIRTATSKPYWNEHFSLSYFASERLKRFVLLMFRRRKSLRPIDSIKLSLWNDKKKKKNDSKLSGLIGFVVISARQIQQIRNCGFQKLSLRKYQDKLDKGVLVISLTDSHNIKKTDKKNVHRDGTNSDAFIESSSRNCRISSHNNSILPSSTPNAKRCPVQSKQLSDSLFHVKEWLSNLTVSPDANKSCNTKSPIIRSKSNYSAKFNGNDEGICQKVRCSNQTTFSPTQNGKKPNNLAIGSQKIIKSEIKNIPPTRTVLVDQKNFEELREKEYHSRSTLHRAVDNLENYEQKKTKHGQLYFSDNKTGMCTWHNPKLKNAGENVDVLQHPLPLGWERRLTDNNRVYFVDHNRRITQYDDPRLDPEIMKQCQNNVEKIQNTKKNEVSKSNAPSTSKETNIKPQPKPVCKKEKPMKVERKLQYKRDLVHKMRTFRNHLKQLQLNGTIKLRISRNNIFSSSYRQIMRLKPKDLRKKLNITFRGESGIDYGGISRYAVLYIIFNGEWIYLISKEVLNPQYGLFLYVREDIYMLQINPNSAIVENNHLSYFHFVGRLLGLALFNGYYIEGGFSMPFYKCLLRREPLLNDLETIDPDLYKSLTWIISNNITEIIDNTFSIETEVLGAKRIYVLCENGNKIKVTEENKIEYVRLYVKWRLIYGIKLQLDNILLGFHEVVPRDLISVFDERELELLICGMAHVNVTDWKENARYKNCNADSDIIKWFWEVVTKFDDEIRSRLLQFSIGSSRVPIQGFQALQGSNTVPGHRLFSINIVESMSQDSLPVAHTCFNRLDLPNYQSYQLLEEKLTKAVEETSGFYVE